jgi:ribosomal protein L13
VKVLSFLHFSTRSIEKRQRQKNDQTCQKIGKPRKKKPIVEASIGGMLEKNQHTNNELSTACVKFMHSFNGNFMDESTYSIMTL